MHYRLNLMVLLAATATASLFRRQSSTNADNDPTDQRTDYLSEVCMPYNSSNERDFTAPCNAVFALQMQCIYGPSYTQQLLFGNGDPNGLGSEDGNGSDSADDQPAPQDNSTQRVCVCESQLFNQFEGCNACMKSHGGVEGDNWFPPSIFSSMSSDYCAASTEPTQGLGNLLLSYVDKYSTATSSASATFSDPLGNRTDVSLYFTPSVTGSAAYIIAEATASGNASSYLSFTSINTVSGQIVPTASAAQTSGPGSVSASASGESSGSAKSSGTGAGAVSGSVTSSASSSATSTAGAIETAVSKEAIAGVLGLVALVAVL